MSDVTIKNMAYILAGVLSIYPVIELLFKKRKWYMRVIIILGLSFFWYVAFRYKKITDKEAQDNVKRANKADSTIIELKLNLNELKNENGILSLKSDTTNKYLTEMKKNTKTKQDQYNTHINNADKVQIGPPK